MLGSFETIGGFALIPHREIDVAFSASQFICGWMMSFEDHPPLPALADLYTALWQVSLTLCWPINGQIDWKM